MYQLNSNCRSRRGRCHAVALWMEFHLTDDITVSTGLTEPVTVQVILDLTSCRNSERPDVSSCFLRSPQGECVWSMHRKQGVYFLREPGQSSGDGRAAVAYSLTFNPQMGDIKMDFSLPTMTE